MNTFYIFATGVLISIFGLLESVMALQCYTQSDGKENPMEPRNCSQPNGENLIPVCYLKKITYFPNEFVKQFANEATKSRKQPFKRGCETMVNDDYRKNKCFGNIQFGVRTTACFCDNNLCNSSSFLAMSTLAMFGTIYAYFIFN